MSAIAGFGAFAFGEWFHRTTISYYVGNGYDIPFGHNSLFFGPIVIVGVAFGLLARDPYEHLALWIVLTFAGAGGVALGSGQGLRLGDLFGVALFTLLCTTIGRVIRWAASLARARRLTSACT